MPEGQNDLLSSIKDVLNKDKRKSNVEEDNGNENETQRTFQNFLTPEGKRIELEGVDERDSIYMRIEGLKMYLEKQLGDDVFCRA